MIIKLIIILNIAFFSCYPKSTLEIRQDDFDESLNYFLHNNILISNTTGHSIELNIQKSISKDGIAHLLNIDCLSSNKIGFDKLEYVTIEIDNQKYDFEPYLKKKAVKLDEDLVFETLSILTDVQLIKKIAYGNDIKIKIAGDKKIVYSRLGLENKINIQNYFETFIPFINQF